MNTLSISHSIKIFCWLHVTNIDQDQGISTSRSMKIWRSENQWTAFAAQTNLPPQQMTTVAIFTYSRPPSQPMSTHPNLSLTGPECHPTRKHQITGKSAGREKIAVGSFEILQQRHHFPLHCALCTARGRFLLSTLPTLVTGGVGQDRSHPSIIRLKRNTSIEEWRIIVRL